MLLLLAFNATLVILLAATHWERLLYLFNWVYSAARPCFSVSTILLLYGVVLLYLLLVVHNLGKNPPQTHKRRQSSIALYYDEDGKTVQALVREDKEPLLVPDQVLPKHGNLSNIPLQTWDGFPDGRFRYHFTHQQVEHTSNVAIHWTFDKLQSGRRGSKSAATPEKGSVSRYRCGGVIECKAADCPVQIAPGKDVTRQTKARCFCGASLRYRACAVQWSLIKYRDGAVFENSGSHTHAPYTHSLPTSRNSTLALHEFVAKPPISLHASAVITDEPTDRSTSSAESYQGENESDPESPSEMHVEAEILNDPMAEDEGSD